ncbi:gliding motility-associated protein GldE [Draconibacterium sp. IB214405]|uniref:gliding motility-associated protein GldE n=1 Tax=Draconibacterium sp. IB214405 TaxID=3097352 RepID=UPI002A0B88AC|nr:gliding motility-associated protein GldE [Draconibacterium sp. IB214405]MDX8341041.1 gliding motility-associated protein GldE [Draconibacterium sp. IB214405]
METEPLLSLASSGSWQIQLHPIDFGIIVSIVIVLFLLFTSALISGSEVAYFSLTASDKQKLKHKGKNNERVIHNLDSPEKLLATILVANNFVNVGIVILTAYISSNLVSFENDTLEFIFQVVVITFFLLLFGEIFPKVYATHFALRFARFMALPLQVLEKLFRPVNAILIYSTGFVNRRLLKHKKNISMDEISQALELTSDQELSEEKEILEGIVKFGNKSVEEIMTPRVDVVSLDIKANFEDVLDVINDSGYSRIPVYIDSFDNISGLLYIKDILQHSHKTKSFKWQTLIRPPFYVPDTKKISSLLEEFQKTKVHLAIVVDEYGGTSGIVTLEDILEEIVGDITDEFDEEEDFFTKLAENTWIFDAKVLLGDFYKIVNCDDTVFDDVKGDADTLAGLILEIKGEIPTLKEKVKCKQFSFTIEEVDNRRIKQIKVVIN